MISVDELDYANIEVISRSFTAKWIQHFDPKLSEEELTRFSLLNREKTEEIGHLLFNFHDGEFPPVNREQFELPEKLNASDLEFDDIHAWLVKHLPGRRVPVVIYWIYQREAVLSDVEIYLNHWDDINPPASDNVIVLPLDEKWILFWDHEEEYYFSYRRSDR